MSAFGFKEWKLVCDAMERGEQSLILRKGGISEGKHGFQWLHREFFLFPTYFHEQEVQLQLDEADKTAEMPTKERETIEIRQYAKIEFTAEITDLELAKGFQDLHIWKPSVIEDRFGWGENNGISLAVVRVYQLGEPWELANRKGFGGCRSWLGMPEDEGLPKTWKQDLKPAMRSEAFVEVLATVKARLDS
tara:strand:+ start:5263 stop:5835 length:573 start_codon:yes stop_codon:yes gene_type:complete